MSRMPGNSTLPPQKPPAALAVSVTAVIVVLWGWINVFAFRDYLLPLSYTIPLLLGVWHRRSWLVWTTVAASLLLAAVEAILLPDASIRTPNQALSVMIARVVNILFAAGVIHAIILLRDRLEARHAALTEANCELAARERKISLQNEELQAQAEEIAQQNEETKAQAEELEQQNEELQVASEELHGANAELARREEMLQTLLTASSSFAGEAEVLSNVCRQGLRMLGGGIVGIAVMEARDGMLHVHSYSGVKTDGEALVRWPLEQSLARLVIEQDRTAALEDASLRPDLIFPMPQSGGAFRAVLATPLRIADQAIGVVEFYCLEPRPWTDDEFRLAEWVAGQCSFILQSMRLRQAVLESEQRYRCFVEASSQVIWTVNNAAEVNMAIPAWQAYTGQSAAEAYGFGWMNAIRGEDRPLVAEAWRKAIESRGIYEVEYLLRRHDGAWRNVLARGVPVKNADGTVREYIGTCIDITDRRHAEEQLKAAMVSAQQAKALAEAASRAKDQFLAVLSHELRTPLTPVLLTASLLAGRRDLPDDVREDIDTIQRNVQLETRLIDDLLDLTRIARGKVKFEFQTIDAHLLIRSAADICDRGEGARIELDLHAPQHWVRGDSARLQQVFWNLLNNARKFTPAGGQIRVSSRNVGEGLLRVEVADTGCGIEPAFLSRVFDAFEQGGIEGGNRPSGLGLGMAISKAIMEAHGGSIAVHSEGKGRGATFTVELPVVTPPPAVITPAERPAKVAPAARALRILLVEDHESTREVLRKLVLMLGHEVHAAGTVELAKHAARSGSFDLVISDLGLPDGTGHELMRWLRQQHGLKGIALSGYGMEEDIRASLDCGFVEHLTKPVSFPQLEAALQRVVGIATRHS